MDFNKFDFRVRSLRNKFAAAALGQNIVITLYCLSVIAGYLQEAVEGSDWAAALDGGTVLPETKDEEELPHLVNWIVSLPGMPRHQSGGYHQTQFLNSMESAPSERQAHLAVSPRLNHLFFSGHDLECPWRKKTQMHEAP